MPPKPKGIRTRCPYCEDEGRLDLLGRPRRIADSSATWGCEGCDGTGYVYDHGKTWKPREKKRK